MMFEDESRRAKALRYEKNGLVIDTVFAPDTGYYESGICDTRYRKDGEWIIVDECETELQTQKMHNKWIKILTSRKLPNKIKDIHLDKDYKLLGGNL